MNFKGMVTDTTIFSENSDLKFHAGISVNDVLASDITQNMIWSGGVWCTIDDNNDMSTTPIIEQPELKTNFKGERYLYGTFFDIYAMKNINITSIDTHTGSLEDVSVEV